jgi:hypothetical protein
MHEERLRSLGKPFSLLSLSMRRDAGCVICADRFVPTYGAERFANGKIREDINTAQF